MITWRTKDGTDIPISDIADSHFVNIILSVTRRALNSSYHAAPEAHHLRGDAAMLTMMGDYDDDSDWYDSIVNTAGAFWLMREIMRRPHLHENLKIRLDLIDSQAAYVWGLSR